MIDEAPKRRLAADIAGGGGLADFPSVGAAACGVQRAYSMVLGPFLEQDARVPGRLGYSGGH